MSVHPNKRFLVYVSSNSSQDAIQSVLGAGFTACRGGKDHDSSMEVLFRSDALYVSGGWGHMRSVVAEIDRAQKSGIPIFYDIEALKKWAVDTPRPDVI